MTTDNDLPPFIGAQHTLLQHLESLITPELLLENVEITQRLSDAVQREFEILKNNHA